MSQVVDSRPGVRAALRSRDPATLGALLASQLAAYRCSTVYGPSDALVRAVIEAHALPLLEQRHEIRRVLVATWPAGGPSITRLIAAMHQQLELSPVEGAEQDSVAALRLVIGRAHRVSDRPLVIVLYGLERLLDDDRDPAADHRLLDALTALVELPMHGLQLVMAVPEQDLGGFRHLLRGRWRLLANDIRIHEHDRRGVVVLPVGGTTAVTTTGAAAAAASTVAAAAGTSRVFATLGGLVGAAGIVAAVLALNAANDARAALRDCSGTPPPTCPECPAPVKCGPGPKDKAKAPDPIDAPPVEPVAVVEPDPVVVPPIAALGEPKEPGLALKPGELAAKPAGMCSAREGDGACATCVRGSCCNQLRSCKSAAWRTCVLTGAVPGEGCAPEAIEKDCRSLALCALEYECNAVCYSK